MSEYHDQIMFYRIMKYALKQNVLERIQYNITIYCNSTQKQIKY